MRVATMGILIFALLAGISGAACAQGAGVARQPAVKAARE
jgi:hypothetical protein